MIQIQNDLDQPFINLAKMKQQLANFAKRMIHNFNVQILQFCNKMQPKDLDQPLTIFAKMEQ